MPTGVMRWKNGILVTAAPDLLYLEDSDGDGQADVRVELNFDIDASVTIAGIQLPDR